MDPGSLQSLQQLPIRRIPKPSDYAGSNYRSDIGNLLNSIFIGVPQRIERTEVPSQRKGGGLADIADAQRIQKARKCRGPGMRNGLAQLERRFFAHPVELGKDGGIQIPEVGWRAHDTACSGLLDKPVPETLDVQSTT